MALESMVASMRTKEAMKRVAFKIPFVLGKDLSIGIVGCVELPLVSRDLLSLLTASAVCSPQRRYNMVGEEKRRLPTKVDLSTQGGDEVITKTVYKDEAGRARRTLSALALTRSLVQDTGEILDAKKEIKKYFQVGRTDYETGTKAAKIFFDDQEIRKVKVRVLPKDSVAEGTMLKSLPRLRRRSAAHRVSSFSVSSRARGTSSFGRRLSTRTSFTRTRRCAARLLLSRDVWLIRSSRRSATPARLVHSPRSSSRWSRKTSSATRHSLRGRSASRRSCSCSRRCDCADPLNLNTYADSFLAPSRLLRATVRIQAEKLNSAGVQIEPPGIHLCQLPFADDIRELGVEPGVSVIRKAGASSLARLLARLDTLACPLLHRISTRRLRGER